MKTKILLFLALLSTLSACVSVEEGFKESPREAARYNAELGMEYMRQGDLRAARDRIDRALKQDPQNPDVQVAAALLNQKVGQHDKAERYFEAARKLRPDDPDILSLYGVFLCNRGRAADGEKLFLKVARNPLYGRPEAAYRNAGVCLQEAGKTVEAEAYFEKAGAR